MFAIGFIGFLGCWFWFCDKGDEEPSPWLGVIAWLCVLLMGASLFDLAWRYLP